MNIRLDDLQTKSYRIYQDTDSFCFGMDAVLLSGFAAERMKKNSCVMDLCSGNGIIPILLNAKTEVGKITAVEVQSEMCSLFEKSLEINSIDNVEILNMNLKDIPKDYYNRYDCITVNPPYYRAESGAGARESSKKIARHEILCTFEDIAAKSRKLLKEKGALFLIHTSSRTEEIISILSDNSFSVKEVRFIYPLKGKNSNLFLLKAVKNGGKETKILPPLTIYDEKGNYTKEVYSIYYGNNL